MFIKTRIPIRKLFTDKCTVEVTLLRTDVFGATNYENIILCEDEPCRISYSSVKSADDTNNGASIIEQKVKLFIREDLHIPAGSKITVTRGNVNTDYKSSGQSAIYSNHQEINLELVERYA